MWYISRGRPRMYTEFLGDRVMSVQRTDTKRSRVNSSKSYAKESGIATLYPLVTYNTLWKLLVKKWGFCERGEIERMCNKISWLQRKSEEITSVEIASEDLGSTGQNLCGVS